MYTGSPIKSSDRDVVREMIGGKYDDKKMPSSNVNRSIT